MMTLTDKKIKEDYEKLMAQFKQDLFDYSVSKLEQMGASEEQIKEIIKESKGEQKDMNNLNINEEYVILPKHEEISGFETMEELEKIEKEYTKNELFREYEKELNEIDTLEKIIEYTKENKNSFVYVRGALNNNDYPYIFEGHVEKGQLYIDKIFDENNKKMEFIGYIDNVPAFETI